MNRLRKTADAGSFDAYVESQLVSPFEEIFIIGNKKGQKNSYSTFSDFFSLKSSSKNLLVDLSQLYSNQNTYLKINKSKAKSSSIPDTSVKLREAEKCSVNEHGETEVKKICQKQRILSKKEREKIKEQYMQGVSTEELAKSFGCHRVTISKALRKAGVTPTIEKLDINDAIRMYESGSTTKEIAEKYHMADNTVSHRLKMAGVKMRNRWDYR